MSLKHNEERRTFIMIFQPKSLLLKLWPTIKDDENMSLKESVYLADGF